MIPVKDLAKYDKVSAFDDEYDEYEQETQQEVEQELEINHMPEGSDKSRQMQLVLVYIIFLAEA